MYRLLSAYRRSSFDPLVALSLRRGAPSCTRVRRNILRTHRSSVSTTDCDATTELFPLLGRGGARSKIGIGGGRVGLSSVVTPPLSRCSRASNSRDAVCSRERRRHADDEAASNEWMTDRPLTPTARLRRVSDDFEDGRRPHKKTTAIGLCVCACGRLQPEQSPCDVVDDQTRPNTHRTRSCKAHGRLHGSDRALLWPM